MRRTPSFRRSRRDKIIPRGALFVTPSPLKLCPMFLQIGLNQLPAPALVLSTTSPTLPAAGRPVPHDPAVMTDGVAPLLLRQPPTPLMPVEPRESAPPRC
jgi:hypothetical protein